MSHAVDGDLGRFIDTNAIDIKGSDGHAGEDLELCHDFGFPFTETILDGSELGELTLPVGVNTKGLHVTKLIEIGGVATIYGDGLNGAIFLPEDRWLTRGIPLIAELVGEEGTGIGVRLLR